SRMLGGCWEVMRKMMGVVGEWWSGLESRGGGAVKVVEVVGVCESGEERQGSGEEVVSGVGGK
nr:hypothetical protein [Tanacetum cinerariifolium]